MGQVAKELEQQTQHKTTRPYMAALKVSQTYLVGNIKVRAKKQLVQLFVQGSYPTYRYQKYL